jgi:Ca2+-binding EF-hand superfamily protein
VFDRDRDDRLERDEMERALFAALDLDGDEHLSRDELSRHPGDLRTLRYGDAAAKELFDDVDRNRNGRVSPRELRLRDEDWLALDADADGAVQLRLSTLVNRAGARPVIPPPVEWPYRRADAFALPPTITRDALYAEFDGDADGRIDKRELKAREDLLRALDRDGSGVLDEREVKVALDRIGRLGVDATVDDFRGRWDLDGDGAVADDEIPNAAVLRARGVLEAAPGGR